MAADYGTAAGVAYLVRHLSNAGTFDNTSASKVTLAAVNVFLEDIGNDMNMILARRGHIVPVTTPTRVKGWLDSTANIGAAMMCELTQASAGFRGVENADTRAGAFKRLYDARLKMMEGQELAALGLSQGTATSRGLWSGSTEDEDGNEKEPMFTREQWDNPGTGLGDSDSDEEA